jgi:hypothetical protein
MVARDAVLLSPAKSTHPRQLWSRRHYSAVNPLLAILTKNRGVQVGASCGFRLLQAYGPNRQCPPQKFWAHQSKIGQLSGFSARNMHLSTARTSEIARYARLGRAVSLLSPLFLFRAFYSAVQSQLNHRGIFASLARLPACITVLWDFSRTLPLFLSRARTSRLLALLLPALCFGGPADAGGPARFSRSQIRHGLDECGEAARAAGWNRTCQASTIDGDVGELSDPLRRDWIADSCMIA